MQDETTKPAEETKTTTTVVEKTTAAKKRPTRKSSRKTTVRAKVESTANATPEPAAPVAPTTPEAIKPAGPSLFSRFGKSLTRICRSVGLYKYSVLAKAPMTFVRERGIALFHAVRQDVRETRAQGRDYVTHIKGVVQARNRLKDQAWSDAKSALRRWEILASRAAASISDAPEGMESEVTQAVMSELATIVETEFRAIVPDDIAIMTGELAKLLRSNDSETAIRSIIEDMVGQKENRRVTTMQMAGASGTLDHDIAAMRAAPAAA